MNIAHPAKWGFSIYYDRNDPPYYCKLMVHIGPWVFCF